MTDHPMLFSPPMILALLREAKDPGTGKTQTRRIIKPQPHGRISMVTSFNHGRMEIAFGPDMRAKDGGPMWWRPLAQPGDRVWCRETWTHTGQGVWSIENARMSGRGGVRYRADHEILGARYFPSIFLPREFSRLTLYVSEVRVQRLQDISEDDARAEGVRGNASGPWGCEGLIEDYADLWESLNGPDSWEANPWVAAYTFRPVLGNIDTLPATLEDA